MRGNPPQQLHDESQPVLGRAGLTSALIVSGISGIILYTSTVICYRDSRLLYMRDAITYWSPQTVKVHPNIFFCGFLSINHLQHPSSESATFSSLEQAVTMTAKEAHMNETLETPY